MLVACVGNIFLSDDGFGVEVARRMAGRPRPDGVELVDFGIRGIHLTYQLMDGYDVLVVVDAAPRGHAPGTVTLLEVDQSSMDPAAGAAAAAAVTNGEAPLLDAHGLEPNAILRMLGPLGGRVRKVLVVACEPATVEEGLGLSPEVQAAVGPAIDLVEELMAAHAGRAVTDAPSEPTSHDMTAEEVSR
jgi:hydrogenase maturation protease